MLRQATALTMCCKLTVGGGEEEEEGGSILARIKMHDET
jgi:hypothetical protein